MPTSGDASRQDHFDADMADFVARIGQRCTGRTVEVAPPIPDGVMPIAVEPVVEGHVEPVRTAFRAPEPQREAYRPPQTRHGSMTRAGDIEAVRSYLGFTPGSEQQSQSQDNTLKAEYAKHDKAVLSATMERRAKAGVALGPDGPVFLVPRVTASAVWAPERRTSKGAPVDAEGYYLYQTTAGKLRYELRTRVELRGGAISRNALALLLARVGEDGLTLPTKVSVAESLGKTWNENTLDAVGSAFEVVSDCKMNVIGEGNRVMQTGSLRAAGEPRRDSLGRVFYEGVKLQARGSMAAIVKAKVPLMKAVMALPDVAQRVAAWCALRVGKNGFSGCSAPVVGVANQLGLSKATSGRIAKAIETIKETVWPTLDARVVGDRILLTPQTPMVPAIT